MSEIKMFRTTVSGRVGASIWQLVLLALDLRDLSFETIRDIATVTFERIENLRERRRGLETRELANWLKEATEIGRFGKEKLIRERQCGEVTSRSPRSRRSPQELTDTDTGLNEAGSKLSTDHGTKVFGGSPQSSHPTQRTQRTQTPNYQTNLKFHTNTSPASPAT